MTDHDALVAAGWIRRCFDGPHIPDTERTATLRWHDPLTGKWFTEAEASRIQRVRDAKARTA